MTSFFAHRRAAQVTPQQPPMASSHLQAIGRNASGVVARAAVPFAPNEDNVNQAFYSAEPSTCVPGGETRIQVPLGEPGNRHTQLNDMVLEFQVQGDDSVDIQVRNGCALIRDLRVFLDNVEVVRTDDELELDLLFRESLRRFYDPARSLNIAGCVPPGSDAATSSIVQAGFETYPAPQAVTYAFKRTSVPGVTSSPYRHVFQLSFARLFGTLFKRFDPRRHRELQVRVQWLPNGSAAQVNKAISFSANTASYAGISFTGIGVRLYRSVFFSPAGSIHMHPREHLTHLCKRYDFATLPADLTVAGQLTWTVNLNALFPARDNCTRVLWCLAPPAPADTATVGWAFENAAAVQNIHTPIWFDISFQGSLVQRVQTGYELLRHNQNWVAKSHRNTDEFAPHPQSIVDFANMPFADLCGGWREVDPGIDTQMGISVGSTGSAQQYVLTLRTIAGRPALSGGPAALWLALESHYKVCIGPGSNTGGPLPVIRTEGL